MFNESGFPVIAETAGSELASTHKLAKQVIVIAWISQFMEHRPDLYFKQKQVDKLLRSFHDLLNMPIFSLVSM